MKKQLLALAIGSLAASPSVVLADKGPTVYGKVNVSYENVDDGNEDQWELRSNASRVGVKGALDLDMQNVEAIYQAEFQVAVDDGDNSGQTFSQRNIFGGFRHANMGTLIAGKFDTPFKKSQGKIDQFGDLGGDINTIVGGSERPSNIIQYSTPRLAEALVFNIAMIPGEGSEEDDDRRDSPADAFSTSLVFDNGAFYGSLGYDSEVKTNLYDFNDDDLLVDAIHAAARVNVQNFELGALVQRSENSESQAGEDYEDMTWIVNGAVKLDRWKLKAQYGLTDMDTLDDDVTLMAVGADYKVGSNSKLFGYYANVEADDADRDDTQFGIGFEHKFSM